MTHLDATDTSIWDAFRQGDRLAFEQLYRLYAKPLTRYGLKINPNRELVLDCIQDVFVYLWEHHQSLGAAQSVQFYLYRTLRWAIVKKIQKESNQLADDDLEAWTEAILSAESNLVSQQTETDRVRHLASCIAQLLPRQR